jgi:hypothetical protein
MGEEDREYTAKEAAELLAVTPERIRQRFHEGELDGRVRRGNIFLNAAIVDSERALKVAKFSVQEVGGQLLEKKLAEKNLEIIQLRETVRLLSEALKVWTEVKPE